MMKYLKKLKSEKGFTLIEMAIVVLIIAGLLLLMITNVGGVTTKVDETTGKGIIQTVETQMILYEVETGNEVSSPEELPDGYLSSEQIKAYNDANANENEI